MDQTSNILSPPELTPLEQDVLDEYERLAENMKKVRGHSSSPSLDLLIILSGKEEGMLTQN